MPPSKKRKLDTSVLTDEQLGRVKMLVDMGMDENRSRDAVLVAIDDDDAVTCCLDDDVFKSRLAEFNAAASISNQREGLRRAGAGTAAAQLAPIGKVPAALLGNAAQTAKSSMAIVTLGSGIASLPGPPPAAALLPKAAASCQEQPTATRVLELDAEPAPEAAAAQQPVELLVAAPLADKERKYTTKLRRALATEPSASRVALARKIVDHILYGLTATERAAVLQALTPTLMLAEPSAAAPVSLAPESLDPECASLADRSARRPAASAAASTLAAMDEDEDEGKARRGEASGGYTFNIFVKTLDGMTLTIHVGEELSVLDLKCAVQRALRARGKEAIEPRGQRLVFGGRTLDDEESVGSYQLRKQSTIHLLRRGRVSAPSRVVHHEEASEVEDDEKDEKDEENVRVSTADVRKGRSSATDASAPRSKLRIHALNRSPEFDGSDGWAVAEGIQVSEAQRWYRAQKTNLRWEEWKNGNRLVYLLNRTSGFEEEVASFLTGKMGNTALGNAAMWQSTPACLLDIDRQLRGVFVNPHLASKPPLLGGHEDGPFVLGYVQVSQMPVALRERAMPRGEARAKVQSEGRSLGLHFDSAAYGDVIITVTAFGHVSIQLKNRTDLTMAAEFLGIERGSRMQGGDAEMFEGDAYSLVGKARWKMLHDAIVPPSSPAIDGLDDVMAGGIARVGYTFRYFRRTFLEVRRREQLVPPPSTPLPQVFDYVDAPYYIDGVVDKAHLYTYAAIVLRVDAASRNLTLQYLSDGLGPDTDTEAFHIADRVPAHCALPMHPSIQSVLEDGHCSWTRQSLRLVQRIREMGVDAYLQESRE